MFRVAFVIGFATACYEPRFQDCAVACSDDTACAPGQACGADGLCAGSARLGRCASTVDAEPGSRDARPLDASTIDAAETCAPGCSGTCQAGVCVIACHAAHACESGVQCPATGPCRVVCDGSDSCKGAVVCGAGACEVACSGKKACHVGVTCGASCACDATCSGEGSCPIGSTCPASCALDAGCTSAGAGCDHC